jgi:hypothetical protein
MTDRSDVDADELDDVRDKDELRQRYYGLLQELRVVLPGIQVLLAFLLTVPFANRFSELDRLGREVFGVAILSALLSVVCLLTPTVYHRVAKRTERSARLAWGIRMTMTGLVLLAVALLSALWCVTRLVFSTTTAWLLTTPVLASIIGLWVVLPVATGRHPDPDTLPQGTAGGRLDP